MILFINTNSKNKIQFLMMNTSGDILDVEEKDIEIADSQNILKYLDEFLVKNNFNKSDIKYLSVVNGLGINMNFRIGIIITNTLGYVLKVPIIPILSSDFSDINEVPDIILERIKNKKYDCIVKPEYSVKKK